MIACLRGEVLRQGIDYLVLMTEGGVGYKVHAPHPTLARLQPGESAFLHTATYVREDTLALYGFATEDELAMFEQLLNISGIGPKLALSLLSVLAPAQLVAAVQSENVDALTRVPGVGKKMAARMLLEMRGKLPTISASGVPLAPVPATITDQAEVMAALGALGYSSAEASAALAALPDDADLTIEDKIRLALRHFLR